MAYISSTHPDTVTNLGASNSANPVHDIIAGPSRKKCKSEVTNDTLRRAAQHRKKAKAGQLEGLMSVPMDVLFEIFGHLLPLDILNLARTTKEFRRVLLHKSSVFVWKSARANVAGLPECPPSMSEPAYANLAFDQHCHICLARNIRSVEWSLRLRICSGCAKIKLMEINVFDTISDIVLSCLSRTGRLLCFVDEIRTVRDHMKSLDDPDSRSTYVEHRKDFVGKVYKHAALCEEWATATKVNRSRELEDVRQDRRRAIVDKLTDLGWGDEIERLPHRALGLHALVKQPTRLTDRIWKNIEAPLVQYMEEMKIQRLKRERKALITSRKHAAISILRAHKISQLPFTEVMPEPVDFCAFPEVQAVLELPSDVDVDESSFSEIIPLLPTIFDRWRSDVTQKLAVRIRQAYEDEKALLEQTVVPTSETDVPELNGKPRPAAEEHTPDLAAEYDPAEKMKLATTIFKCRKCGERYRNWLYRLGDVSLACHNPPPIADVTYPLFYPQVLGHRCLTRPETDDYNTLYHADPSRRINMDASPFANWYALIYRQNWDCVCLAVDAKSGERVAKIVKACGLDPATTTAEEMDRLDTRLGCPDCLEWHHLGPDTARLTCFGWREALQHQSAHHHDKDIDWMKLGEGIINGARELEKMIWDSISGEDSESDTLDPPSGLVVWMCTHCLDLPAQTAPRELHNIKAHLHDGHDIIDPQPDTDYYKDLEAPQGNYTDTPNKIAILSLDLTKLSET